MEHASLAELAVNPDRSSHHAYKLPRDRQAQPGPAIPASCRCIGLEKLIKNLVDHVVRDARPRITHAEACDLLVGIVDDSDLDLARVREFHGVANKVRKHLPNPPCIADHPGRHRCINCGRQGQRLVASERTEQGGDVIHN